MSKEGTRYRCACGNRVFWFVKEGTIIKGEKDFEWEHIKKRVICSKCHLPASIEVFRRSSSKREEEDDD